MLDSEPSVDEQRIDQRRVDILLLRRAQSGERDALEELLIGYQPLLERYLLRLLEDPVIADDVQQEVYLRVVRGLPGLRKPERFGSWLKSIAWREARAWVRRVQRGVRQQTLADDAAAPPDPYLADEAPVSAP